MRTYKYRHTAVERQTRVKSASKRGGHVYGLGLLHKSPLNYSSLDRLFHRASVRSYRARSRPHMTFVTMCAFFSKQVGPCGKRILGVVIFAKIESGRKSHETRLWDRIITKRRMHSQTARCIKPRVYRERVCNGWKPVIYYRPFREGGMHGFRERVI